MTALNIAVLVLLFLGILLFAPVSLRFAYENKKMRATVHYLFIRLNFSPEALTKRAEKKAVREVKEEYKEKEKKEKPPKAARDTAKTVWELIKSSKKGFRILRKHLIFYKIKIRILAGGEDAAETAILYGRLCALIANGISLLGVLFAVREPEIAIAPDFLSGKSVYDLRFRVRISPWYVLRALLYIVVRFLKITGGAQKNKKKREKNKGGKHHEPTASCQ